MLSTIFTKKKGLNKKKVNILGLQINDLCYYNNHKDPFKVTETGFTNRGVFFVEIQNIKSGKSHIFTDSFPVLVDDIA
jgi:hypothetical protein